MGLNKIVEEMQEWQNRNLQHSIYYNVSCSGKPSDADL
jgi:hypothetical protein